MVLLMNPETGRVFEVSKYADVNGTPFLVDEWMAGDVRMSEGLYQNLRLKFDVYEQVLYFEREGQAFSFKDPVKGFTLKPKPNDSSSYRYFLQGVGGMKGFIEQVVNGRLSFYRSDQKLLSDVNEINRGVIKTFNTSVRYYLKDNSGMHLIRLSEKEIFPFLSDRSMQMKSIIEGKNLNLKKEKDVAVLIRHYNF